MSFDFFQTPDQRDFRGIGDRELVTPVKVGPSNWQVCSWEADPEVVPVSRWLRYCGESFYTRSQALKWILDRKGSVKMATYM